MFPEKNVAVLEGLRHLRDGDTFLCDLNLGFGHIVQKVACRVDGIDTPEKSPKRVCTVAEREYEKTKAAEAKVFTQEWFARHPLDNHVIRIVTTVDDERTQGIEYEDAFGRYLADVYCETCDDNRLAVELLKVGLASVWPLRWHEQYGTPQ